MPTPASDSTIRPAIGECLPRTSQLDFTEETTGAAPRARARLARCALVAALSVAFALAVKAWVVAPTRVTSGSMKNSLQTGDIILVNAWPVTAARLRGRSPRLERGDVIVFGFPGAPPDSPPPTVAVGDYFVKRVMGLPGDRVEVRGAFVYVNGVLVNERRAHAIASPGGDLEPLVEEPGGVGREAYAAYYDPAVGLDEFPATPAEPDALERFGGQGAPVTVPPHSYFVLGDNRSHSYDSRYWGFVPESTVVGRAVLVAYHPSDRSRIGAAVR